MVSHYSRIFGGPFAGHDESHLRELSMRMKDIPENRRGRPRRGDLAPSAFVYLGQFLDHDLTSATDAELTRYRREHVGFVFQFYNLIPSLTAIENVALVTDISEHPMRPADALALVGLQDRSNHFPAQMSGGEQQRIAIARAIAKRPDVLLCDEPTGALDYETGKLVLKAIDRVNRELGTTTTVITHNVAIAAMADRVVRMTSGRISDDKRNEKRVSPEDLSW